RTDVRRSVVAPPGRRACGRAGPHPVEHVFIHPALDAPQLGWRAPRSERASEAGAQMAIDVEVLRVIRPAIGLGEFGARRASVVVVLGVVDEVLPGKEAALGAA